MTQPKRVYPIISKTKVVVTKIILLVCRFIRRSKLSPSPLLLTILSRLIHLYTDYSSSDILQVIIFVCSTVSWLRFYGCCHPCFSSDRHFSPPLIYLMLSYQLFVTPHGYKKNNDLQVTNMFVSVYIIIKLCLSWLFLIGLQYFC